MSKNSIIALTLVVAVIIAGTSFLLLKKGQNVDQNIKITQKPDLQINISPSNVKGNNDTVPLPTEEDIIRVFFNLINEHRIPEAISMMSEKMVPDDSTKQAWGVQFNSLKNIVVKKVEPSMKEEWTAQKETFKVNVNLEVSKEAANAPIPYYGWENGDNIRWVSLEKDQNNLWKVAGIATGP
jgi:hypothetical protein